VDVSSFEGPSDFARLVERHLEIVGEALRRLRDYDNDTFGSIRMGDGYVALRNVIAHGYEQLNYYSILNTCQTEIPLVLEDARRLLANTE
jgi:uncharacterized protein with HEPN domain